MSQISFDRAIELALEQHRAGQFARAEALYLEILRQDPGNVDAIHLLGVLAHQGKRPDLAEQLIGRAVGRRGDVPVFHYNLAEAYRVQGKLPEAAASYRRAIELAPAYAEAHNNLSIVLHLLGQSGAAADAARQSVELDPDSAAGHNNLGNALRATGHHADAEAAYRRAIALRPEFPDAMNNLATLIGALGRLEEAVALLQEAVRVNPTDAKLHNNLGSVLSRLNRHAEAAKSYERAITLDPAYIEPVNNFGSALRSLGEREQAVTQFEKALEINPDYLISRVNLAYTLKDLGRHEETLKVVGEILDKYPDSPNELYLRAMTLRDMYRIDEAVEGLRDVVRVDPTHVAALTSLASNLLERGDMDGALSAMNKVVELRPDPLNLSNVLMTANYHPSYSPADLHRMHRVWAEAHEAPLRGQWGGYANDRTPDRRLRVGYVSPDFRGHVVAHFLEPILDHHDHARFEVYGYANLTHVDLRTYKMRAQIDHWREIAGKSPADIARLIREDGIDILVEVAGHTAGNALEVFARKPAPVQINMIGFPSTTGLSAMDYRITDARCDPPGASDAFNSEKLIRLPRLWWVFQPTAHTPDVGPLPADANGHLTFTSVNNFTKVTPQTQTMWAKLLAAVPGSRLILQTGALASEQTQDAVRARFAAHGVEASRLDFRPWSDLWTFNVLVNDSDLTLDPFPFNGGTTTCNSLWMGAPVLTLAGDRHASRMGLSIMTAVGLPEFVAHTPEQYVEIGRAMADDLPHLREVRRGLRERMKASPLLDGPGYTRELEDAYRDVWANWCAGV